MHKQIERIMRLKYDSVKCIVRTVKDQYADWKFNLNYFTNKSRKYNYPGSDRGFNYSHGNSHDISICIGPVCPRFT